MQIHVARHQQQLGVFAAEDIVAGLSTGRFHASDLAWREGLPAWTPLGDWPEFRGAGVPAAPGETSASASVASQIPWEQGKSLGSFFATIKQAIVDPASLATGRFAFGDWLTFCYLGMLFSLPFQLLGAVVYGDKNAQVAEFLSALNHPELRKAAEQLARAEPTPTPLLVFGALMGLAIAPLLYALFGLIHWVGQRIFRYQVTVERTAAASLLATALVVLLTTPLQLLGFSLPLQGGLSFLLSIPALVLYFRAFGAATGVNPWAQFGIACFIWFVLFCCCCVAPIMLLSGAMAGVAMR